MSTSWVYTSRPVGVRHTFCFTMPANSLYTDSKTASGSLSASSINCSNSDSVGIGAYDIRH